MNVYKADLDHLIFNNPIEGMPIEGMPREGLRDFEVMPPMPPVSPLRFDMPVIHREEIPMNREVQPLCSFRLSDQMKVLLIVLAIFGIAVGIPLCGSGVGLVGGLPLALGCGFLLGSLITNAAISCYKSRNLEQEAAPEIPPPRPLEKGDEGYAYPVQLNAAGLLHATDIANVRHRGDYDEGNFRDGV